MTHQRMPAGTFAYVSNYEWHVELAAKGLRERDRFYLMMARAVLDSSGLLAVLELVTQAERDLEITYESLGHADAENARDSRDGKIADEALRQADGKAEC